VVIHCPQWVTLGTGSNEIKALRHTRPIQTDRRVIAIHNKPLSNTMQGMGVSSGKELLLMSSALKDNGSTSQWRKIRQRILQRDGYTCQSCGGEGNSVDHILPRLAGGTDHEWNLQTLCGSCNSSKGGRFFNEPKTPLTLSCLILPQNDSRSHEND
jgi:hypothetical protein